MPVPAPPVDAIGYVRVSTAREDMISPDIQKAAITDWARRSGRRIVRWIVDLDATGRNFRRKVMKGVAAIEDGEVAEIVVYRYDRWGRRADDSLANIKRVENAGGAVVSATEPLDPETSIGKYNRTNSLALAEMQSGIIGDNWKAALASRVGRHLPATGTARFGYARRGRVPDPVHKNRYRVDTDDHDGERYEPDLKTGPVLEEMYSRYVAGQSGISLVHWLNGTGIRTVRNGTWSLQTLFNVLDSGFGAGLLRVHDPSCKCKRSKRGESTGPPCRRVVWLAGSQSPVISLETWEAYKQRRTALRKLPPRLRAAVYPLSGLLFCGECGDRLVITNDHGRIGTGYRCTRASHHRGCSGSYVRRKTAEDAVMAELARYAADIDARRRVTRAREKTATSARASRTRAAAQIVRTDKALARLVTQRALDDEMPAAAWEQSRSDLLAKRAEAEAVLGAAGETETLNAGDWLPVAAGLLRDWDTLPASRRRDLLAMVIARVMIYRTGVRQPPRIEVIPVWEMREASAEVQ
jgi:site-specific DNA recombinase